jgi:hypothetical protein
MNDSRTGENGHVEGIDLDGGWCVLIDRSDHQRTSAVLPMYMRSSNSFDAGLEAHWYLGLRALRV